MPAGAVGFCKYPASIRSLPWPVRNDYMMHRQPRTSANTSAFLPTPFHPLHMDNIVSLFAESVGHHAPRVAIEDWTQTPPSKRQYTYAELDHAASKLAHTLHTNGVRRGDRVPLLAARSPAMVTAVLAILKLGACYVPVDLSSWGPDRIETTLRIVGASVVVCTEKVRLDLPGYSVVFFGTQDMDCEVEDATYPVVQGSTPARDDLAYIIFTSGSTGKPKGVMVAHSSMANYARSNGNETSFDVKVTPHSRILMLFSIAFDGKSPPEAPFNQHGLSSMCEQAAQASCSAHSVTAAASSLQIPQHFQKPPKPAPNFRLPQAS